MHMRKGMIVLAAISALASTGWSARAQEGTDDAAPTPAPPGAKVNFLDIQDGQRIPAGRVIHFGLSKMGVAPAGVEKENTGHHHLLIDEAAREKLVVGERIASDEKHIHFGNGQTEWEVDLEPGVHEIRLLVGDAGHAPHNPPIASRIVQIVVTSRAGTAALPDEATGQTAALVEDCDNCGKMVVVPAGKFRMGTKGHMSESPVRTVTFKRPFAIAKYPVTFGDWQACVDDGGCGGYTPKGYEPGREDRPVSDVTWNEAKDYIRWLSEKSGQSYRLPTEAEWEYAAKAGAPTTYEWGSEIGIDNANCRGCNDDVQKQTVAVTTYSENGWGIGDMPGNAAEWVEDCWHTSYQGAPSDGSAWDRGGDCERRVLKGGNFRSSKDEVRPASRAYYEANVRYYANGFRIARDAD